LDSIVAVAHHLVSASPFQHFAANNIKAYAASPTADKKLATFGNGIFCVVVALLRMLPNGRPHRLVLLHVVDVYLCKTRVSPTATRYYANPCTIGEVSWLRLRVLALLLYSTLATAKGSDRGSGEQKGSHTSLVLRPGGNRVKPLPLFEIALVLVRFDHVASVVINANARIHVIDC
jgi:hypothetical protein